MKNRSREPRFPIAYRMKHDQNIVQRTARSGGAARDPRHSSSEPTASASVPAAAWRERQLDGRSWSRLLVTRDFAGSWPWRSSLKLLDRLGHILAAAQSAATLTASYSQMGPLLFGSAIRGGIAGIRPDCRVFLAPLRVREAARRCRALMPVSLACAMPSPPQ